jgi:putative DNA primase/helicase
MPSSNETLAEVIQLVQAKLVTGPRKGVKANLTNAKIILELDSRWVGVIAWDEFQGCIVKLKSAPCGGGVGAWTDIDTVRVTDWISVHYKLDILKGIVVDAIRLVGDRHIISPMADWLRGLKWDGVKRIDRLFVDYFGAEDNVYICEVGKNLMIGAINRVLTPGVALHEVVILEGKQGAGKSRGIKVLFGKELFSDTPLDVGNKDAYLAMRGKWCVELGELSSMSKTDANAMKVFVSSPTDRFRVPYGREPEDMPRRCVFIGTTNDSEYLQDSTGNRRWLPVEVGIVLWDAIERDRTQLWAEAFERAASGEDYWLTPAAASHAFKERGRRHSEDPWQPTIEEWLERQQEPPTSTAILEGAIGKSPKDITRADQSRIGRIMQALGWAPRQASTGKRAYHKVNNGVGG